jgi:hypothetical protein
MIRFARIEVARVRIPVRSVIALPQPAQKQMPVSSVGPAHDPRRRQRWAASLEQRLHRLELGGINDRWHRHFHHFHFRFRFALARLPEPRIEPMAADVGRTR